MKSISNSDFSLLVEKLPIVLGYAKTAISASDLKAVNALRVLGILQKKLEKQKALKYKEDDKK